MPFDFDAAVSAPFRMQPGLRRLAPGTPQLTPSHPGGRHLREKLQVLRRHAREALLAADGFDAAPALAVLANHAAREHPSALRLVDGGRLEAPLLGWALHDGLDPRPTRADAAPDVGLVLAALPAAWRRAALISLAFEQDVAIVDGRSARIPWLAVCLPSHWAPESKVGRHFAEVHAPVADNALLLAAGDRLMRLVVGDDHWERFVWTVTRHAGLHAHPRHVPREPWPDRATPEQLAAACHFRTEHQTFIPAPAIGQAVFTIHVQVQPLAEAVEGDGRAARLAAALASMSDAVLAYRGLSEARDRLVAWLESRAR